MSKNNDLEFVSISHDDEDNDDMTTPKLYGGLDSNQDSSVLGSWILKQSKNPVALIFHLLFKTLAILVYMFGSWVSSSFIFQFVLCILLLAFDFWTVKNISGRLLVGLRWWSYVRDDGSNDWVFESLEDTSEISLIDSRIFWTALFVSPAIWAFYLFIGIITFNFENIPLILAAISMNMANVYGYSRCSSSAKKRMEGLVEQGIRSTTMAAAMSNSTVANWIFNSFITKDSVNNQSSSNNNNNSNNNSNRTELQSVESSSE